MDYINPNIGGIGHLLIATAPYVQCPYGMAHTAPVTTPWITGRYLADKIYGLSSDPVMLMAPTGPAGTQPRGKGGDLTLAYHCSISISRRWITD